MKSDYCRLSGYCFGCVVVRWRWVMPVLSQGGLARHGVPAVVWREGLAGLRVPVRSVLWLAHRHTSQGCRYTRPRYHWPLTPHRAHSLVQTTAVSTNRNSRVRDERAMRCGGRKPRVDAVTRRWSGVAHCGAGRSNAARPVARHRHPLAPHVKTDFCPNTVFSS